MSKSFISMDLYKECIEWINKPLIENEDKLLNKQLIELDEGTRARNRLFQQRLDDIWHSSATFEAKLKVESKEAMETILNLKDNFDTKKFE